MLQVTQILGKAGTGHHSAFLVGLGRWLRMVLSVGLNVDSAGGRAVFIVEDSPKCT